MMPYNGLHVENRVMSAVSSAADSPAFEEGIVWITFSKCTSTCLVALQQCRIVQVLRCELHHRQACF